MATKVAINLVLAPVNQPWVRINCGSFDRTIQLKEPMAVDFDFLTNDKTQTLTISHINKPANDASTAVEIVSIGFFNIVNDRFKWAGTYRPDYPDHYPDKIAELPGCTYLGWNGVYTLEFGVPVFTWMHKILGMGWIYD